MGSFYSYYDRYSLSHAKNRVKPRKPHTRSDDDKPSEDPSSSGSNQGSHRSRRTYAGGSISYTNQPSKKESNTSTLINYVDNAKKRALARRRAMTARTIQNADADRAKQAYLASQRASQASAQRSAARQEPRERVFPQRPFSRPTTQQLRKPTEDKRPVLPVSPALMAQALGFTPGDDKAIEWIRRHPTEALAAMEDSIRRGDPRWKSGNVGGIGNPAIMKTILGNLNSRRSYPNNR